ncbi:MAG: Gfo/Idh/MocA family protein [Acidimicrobiia bacterium]
MRKLRWGVLGTAKVARQKVIPAIQSAPRCEVVAIASRDPVRAGEAAQSLGIGRAYGSYQELLEDPEVEAVYIPLPNHLHAPWTLAAAQAGKHVLVEKPLALSTDQAEEMVEACRRAGVKLMEGFMYRLHPQWVTVRELVTSGRLGELRAVQGFFSYRQLDPANIRNVHDYGGGGLMDIGCYGIDLSRMLFETEPARVMGMVRRHPDWGIDVLTSVLLEFEAGQASFTCGTQMEHDQRVHLIGTLGRLLVEIPFNIPPDRSTRLLLGSGGHPPIDLDTEVITIPPADQYSVQAQRFAEAVLEGAPVPIPAENGIANLRVIEEVLASADG